MISISRKLVTFCAIVMLFCIFQHELQSNTIPLFQISKELDKTLNSGTLEKGDFTNLLMDKSTLNKIISEKSFSLEFDLPVENGIAWKIRLNRIMMFAPDAKIVAVTDNGEKELNIIDNILTYRGELLGKKGAVVNFTFSDNFISGVITDESGTFVIGNKENTDPTSYILYKKEAVKNAPRFSCGVADNNLSEKVLRAMNEAATVAKNKNNDNVLNNKNLTVEVAVETDYQTYQFFKQDNQKLSSYITSLISITSQIYERDVNAKFEIKIIHIWDTPNDPYPDNNVYGSDQMLSAFQTYWDKNMQSTQRDLAIFITTRTGSLGGVAASIGGICTGYDSYCFCDIKGTFLQLPAYSWDAMVVTHECGHVFGSSHTHSCFWPGGALDSCVQSESGECFDRTVARKGTIMSYCHLTDSGSAMVFHPLCASLIRNYLERSYCIGAPADADYSFTLSGKVLFRGNPLANTKISISNFVYSFWLGSVAPMGDTICTTDNNGNYVFSGLAAGFYNLSISDGYVILPYGNQNSGTVIVPKLDTKKDLHVEKTYKVSGNITGISTIDSVNFIVVRPDSNESSNYNYLTLPLNNSQKLVPGTYILIPYQDSLVFTPNIKTFTVIDNDLTDINFGAAANSSCYKTWGTVKYRNAQGKFIPLPIVNILFQNQAGFFHPDINGIYVNDKLPSGSSTVKFSGFDTTKFAPNSDPEMYIYSSGYSQSWPNDFSIRDRILPPFTQDYVFQSKMGNYQEIDGDTIQIGNNYLKSTMVRLPFHFLFGKKEFDSLQIRPGFLTLGNSEVYYNPISNYGIAGGCISAFSGLQNYDDFLPSSSSILKTAVTGSAPNRVFTVQWKNFSIWTFDSINNNRINVQIKLFESSGNIEFSYGKFTIGANTYDNPEVGLRGTDGYDFRNRAVDNDWSNSSNGTTNKTTCSISGTVFPASGLTYKWVNIYGEVISELAGDNDGNLSIFPSIAGEEVNIRLYNHKYSDVKIEILNIMGETISTIYSGSLRTGVNNFRFETDCVQDGTYFCHVRNAYTNEIKKFIVVH